MESFTSLFESELTSAPLIYKKEVRKMLSTSELQAAVGDYQKYRQLFLEQLDKVRSLYFGRMRYAVVSLLHRKYLDAKQTQAVFAKPDPENGEYIVFSVEDDTFKVHKNNIQSPEALDRNDGDLKVYGDLLVRISVWRGRVNDEEKETVERNLKGLLSKDFDNISAQTAKKQILEACYYLGFRAVDAEYLLLRYGDSLSANCVEDHVFKFMLDVPEAKLEDWDRLLTPYREASESNTEKAGTDASRTDVSYASLNDIIDNKGKGYAEKIGDYGQMLAKYADVFRRVSKTSRQMLEHILLYAVKGLGWEDKILESLPKSVLECETPPLNEAQRERLVLALLTGTATAKEELFDENNRISFPYHLQQIRIVMPEIDESDRKTKRMDMGERFLDLLNSREAITKNDIVFAVYLMILHSDHEKSDPVKSYRLFREISDAVLKKLLLPGFYPPQTVEFACGKSVLAGKRREEAYLDVMRALLPVNTAENTASAAEEVQDTVMKLVDTADLPNSYKRFEKALKAYLKTLSFDEKPEGLMAEAYEIGEKIFSIWEENSFISLKVTIPNGMTQIEIKLDQEKPFALDHTMSGELHSFLNVMDKDYVALDRIRLPQNRKTIRELAADYEIPESYKNTIQKRNADLQIAADTLARKSTDGKVPELVRDTQKAYGLLQKECKNLGDFLSYEPDWNRRIRRTTILRTWEALLLRRYGLEEFQKEVSRGLKGSAGGVPAGFKMPVVQVRENCILTLDNMNRSDLEFYIRRKKIGKPKEEAPEEAAGAAQTKQTKGKEMAASQIKEQFSHTPTYAEALEETLEEAVEEEWDKELEQELKDIQEKKCYGTKDPFKQFLSMMSEYPKLTNAEEAELAVAAQNDKDARDKLIVSSWRLAYYAAKNQTYARASFMDLVSSGMEGIIHAVDRFNPEKGTRFKTYALRWIRYYIQEQQYILNYPIKIPRETLRALAKANKFRAETYRDTGELPSEMEVAKHLGIPLEQLPAEPGIYRLDDDVGQESDTPRGELIPDENATAEHDELVIMFNSMLNEGILSPREEEVIKMHYGLIAGDTKEMDFFTLPAIAKFLGISIADVVIAEVSAFRKIRNAKESTDFREMLKHTQK